MGGWMAMGTMSSLFDTAFGDQHGRALLFMFPPWHT